MVQSVTPEGSPAMPWVSQFLGCGGDGGERPDKIHHTAGMEVHFALAEELLVALLLCGVPAHSVCAPAFAQYHVNGRVLMNHAGEELPELKVRVRQGVPNEDDTASLH